MSTQNPDGSIYVEHLAGCARCHGEGHNGLTFERLEHPIAMDSGEPPMTHWAPCPTNGQPITLRAR